MAKDEEKLYKAMGKRITDLRVKAGFKSQEAFAYEAEIPRAQYGRYEAGTNITVKNLQKIVRFHKISLAEFFSEGFEKVK